MNMRIFCVRDRQTDQYGTPMFLLSAGQAIRTFTDEINRKENGNALNAHPEDYDLYEVGTWNTDEAKFETHTPKQIAVGLSMVIK